MKYIKIIIILLLAFTLSSCNSNTSEDLEVRSINLRNIDRIEYKIGSSNLSDFKLYVVCEDFSNKVITITSDMIQNYQNDTFTKIGLKTLKIVYQGRTLDVDCLVYENNLDYQLLNIYETALLSSSTELTYDEWLNTIRGEDGRGITDAAINQDGHLILTFSDNQTIDVGLVVGTQEEISFDIVQIGDKYYFSWKYISDNEWTPISEVDSLIGVDIPSYYIVNFYNISGLIVNQQIIESGQSAENYVLNMPEGYSFIEWNTNFSNVQSNLNIYPVFNITEYQVSLINEDQTSYITVNHNSTINLPFLTKEGFIFNGWFTENGELITSDTRIKEDLVLYPHFKRNTYEISFETGTDSSLGVIQFEYGTYFDLPDFKLENEKLVFNGWFYDPECTLPFNPNLAPAEDITLYAMWLDIEYMISSTTVPFIILLEYNSNYTDLRLPEKIDGYPLGVIADYVFFDTNLENVWVPDTVMSIGMRAFANNSNLSYVNLKSESLNLDEEVFANNPLLETIILPEELTELPARTFKNNTSLTAIDLPNTINNIGPDAFAYTNIEVITLPDSLNGLTEGELNHMYSLTTIHINNSLQQLYDYAFFYTDNIHTITEDLNPYFSVIDNVIYTEDYTELLYYPTEKKDSTYIIPIETTSIHQAAIYNNPYLTQISLPDHISYIGSNNFFNTPLLTAFNTYTGTLAQSIISTDGVLFNSSHTVLIYYPDNKPVTSYYIPSVVEEVGWGAFSFANNLTEIWFEAPIMGANQTHTIGEYAFYNVDLVTSLSLPPNLTTIKSHAFAEMDSLISISGHDNVSTIESYILYNSRNIHTFIIYEAAVSIDPRAFVGTDDFNAFVIPAHPSLEQAIDHTIYSEDFSTLLFYTNRVSLTEFIVPLSVTTSSAIIEENQDIERIVIHENVTSFVLPGTNCPNLTTIVINRPFSMGVTNLIITDIVDPDLLQNIVFVVPVGSAAGYQNHYDNMGIPLIFTEAE